MRAQLVAKLPKADYFALQLDESTDVSNDPQLLAFVWLSTKMRYRRNVYSVSSCMDVQKSFSVNMIYPGQNVSRCTQTVQEPCVTHCMVHRENLVAKDMSDELSNVRPLTRHEIFHHEIFHPTCCASRQLPT